MVNMEYLRFEAMWNYDVWAGFRCSNWKLEFFEVEGGSPSPVKRAAEFDEEPVV